MWFFLFLKYHPPKHLPDSISRSICYLADPIPPDQAVMGKRFFVAILQIQYLHIGMHDPGRIWLFVLHMSEASPKPIRIGVSRAKLTLYLSIMVLKTSGWSKMRLCSSLGSSSMLYSSKFCSRPWFTNSFHFPDLNTRTKILTYGAMWILNWNTQST